MRAGQGLVAVMGRGGNIFYKHLDDLRLYPKTATLSRT
jgi:hypothetical protein